MRSAGHEDVVDREVMGAGAPHAAHVPGVEQLRLGDRHEHVARLGRLALHPHLAVVDDLRVGGHPGGVSAAGAEALPSGDAIAARHHHRLGGRGRRVGHHRARRIDPDLARHLARHARGVGRVDRALVHAPAGARVGLAELLDHLGVGRQVDLAAADGAGHRHVKDAGVGQRLEQRPRQLALGLDLVGAGADLGRQLAGGFERRQFHRVLSSSSSSSPRGWRRGGRHSRTSSRRS